MAKVILEFDPNEDRSEMESALNGWKWQMLAWDVDQHLRSELKYNDKVTEEVYEALKKVREYLRGEMQEQGLTFND